jgi:ABC-type polysaccharide/polyol phosphate export permease
MTRPVYTNLEQGRVLRVLPDLFRARELLADLIWKDIRIRYRYAVMGFLWAVLEPLIMMAVLTFVFSLVFRMKVEALGIESGRQYAVFVLSGLIPWQFFSTAVSRAARSLVDNRNLVNKVHFPREVIPLSAIGVAFVNFLIGSVLLLGVFALLMGRLPGANAAWVLAVFPIQLALVVGLALFFSAANAFFRDVAYMVDAALLFGFYATPVFYAPSLVSEHVSESLLRVYMLNPLAGLFSAYRDALFLDHAPSVEQLWPPAAISAAVLAVGVVFFRKRAAVLADYL